MTELEHLPPLPDMVAHLQDALGSRLTALLVGIGDANVLDEWVRGEANPSPYVE